MMETIRIEIPQFIREVQLSAKQMPKYYEWNGVFIKAKGRKMPVSWFKKGIVIPEKPKLEHLKEGFVIGMFKNKVLKGVLKEPINSNELISKVKSLKYLLCTTIVNDTPIPILANPKKIGTPRVYLINGQDIYNGFLHTHMKGKVMDAIKEYYKPFIKDLAPITEYPIKIEVELHYPMTNQGYDLDNFMYCYYKAFPDLLIKEGILKDDNRQFITQTGKISFVPIENYEDRKLVFIISKEDRVEILENKIYTDHVEIGNFPKISKEIKPKLKHKFGTVNNELDFNEVEKEFKLKFKLKENDNI